MSTERRPGARGSILTPSMISAWCAGEWRQGPSGGTMSTREKKTITEFMIEEQRRFPEAAGDFTAVLNHVRLACKRISFIVGRGALGRSEEHTSELQSQF